MERIVCWLNVLLRNVQLSPQIVEKNDLAKKIRSFSLDASPPINSDKSLFQMLPLHNRWGHSIQQLFKRTHKGNQVPPAHPVIVSFYSKHI